LESIALNIAPFVKKGSADGSQVLDKLARIEHIGRKTLMYYQ
jgi:hypothetical protein